MMALQPSVNPYLRKLAVFKFKLIVNFTLQILFCLCNLFVLIIINANCVSYLVYIMNL